MINNMINPETSSPTISESPIDPRYKYGKILKILEFRTNYLLIYLNNIYISTTKISI
jgi:hypothetical protein